MADPIKVLLVDDHAVVRSGLGAVLMTNDDMVLVGEAGNGQEAIKFCEKNSAGRDINGPHDAGHGWCRRHYRYPSALASHQRDRFDQL